MGNRYADVIIDISNKAVDKTFQYKIPELLYEDVSVGIQVTVPFGKSNSNRNGYVIGITEEPLFDENKIKEIVGIPDRTLRLEGKLIQLASWMRLRYNSTMIDALNTVMPVKQSVRKTAKKVALPDYEIIKPPVLELNEEQNIIVSEFIKDLTEGKINTYLLKGITGSGKTEVYISCIKEMISKGLQTIVLVPEIALTYQSVARFKQHFGERVAVISSEQSKGEKFEVFSKARSREIDVIIGPRSALFTPCSNLGLIIIDEEHDGAYKSEQSPRYHARETAAKRAEIEDVPLILGSATPSMESYYLTKLGKYKLWNLNKRASGNISEVHIIDMRQELKAGNRTMISRELHNLVIDRLSKNEQILLFINRRGYNNCISCRECGEVFKCPKCDVSLTSHINRLICHYCGYSEVSPKSCKACGSVLIKGFGTGTEKVEEEIHRLFPNVRTLRLDRDTVTSKGSYGRILSDFNEHKADVLIGTQMIVKGHDFENVTLVGAMLADASLFANDYMAGERTFDLLTQAAGRAGRGKQPGTALIQTYQPDNYAIRAAAKQSYEDFFELEINYRKMLKYPPIYIMMVLFMTSENCEELSEYSSDLYKSIGQLKDNYSVSVIGPTDATIAKINNVYRKVIYVKAKDQIEIDAVARTVQLFTTSREVSTVKIITDTNPVNMY